MNTHFLKKTTLAISLAATLGLTGCQINQSTTTPAVSAAQVQQNFADYSTQFIERLWQENPEWSLWVGYGKYDHILTIPNAASREKSLASTQAELARLATFDVEQLNQNQKTDYYLIKNMLDKNIWQHTKFKSWQWDPSNYNVAGAFAKIINSRLEAEDSKLQKVLMRMENVPAYYQAAQANIDTPTLEFTQLAISQNQGAFSVFSDDLLARAQKSGLSDSDKALFVERFNTSKQAVQGYIDFLTELEKELVANNSARSFRIGEALYEEKFAFDIQSGYTAKQMYQKALDDKARVTQEMVQITTQLWPKYFADQAMPSDTNQAIAKLINHLAVKHVSADQFVPEIKRQIPVLEKFVREKDLITLDADKPLVVRETPDYMRGFAGASISAPGPYDSKENTYYNVTPLDGMGAEQAESYLKEYNHWILQILNIHEAIPGHYAQLVYANQSPSLIKSILGNGAMIEGWAVYTERMMLEEGYGNFEPEMWLMYYKWNLRVICNTILDYSIQVLNMSKEQGLDLLMNGAFQERAEAEGKWRRATLSQVQLTSYFSGYREIYDFRETQKQKLGNDFSLKAFHEAFLSFGSSPVKYIKPLMDK
ncbi:DUF885 domain-containing protein [Pseudoalteromonas tunicata]|uniref:Lipoprotein, putative n=1 Tax=Pseudoalteromonas tunicata D2 TaxID=87626 RepID=A4C9B1_9GAMM|nr:DUF885 domain-containing protein [Pseudoalteromonas tunicata]ATC93680.1 hypothetical protein PTUN_a0976 [Pseudoalteromonas tunicata]AXT29509.1 DUF885 domain-containing protein [Pseudoalteromonas tunicata]EAR29176.1 lipoprotein, putative [Pseudoalteromonas tunicata D2]MDP4983542.1 DUF885 domain-containing protein [Pseudoalteromonas tunicata]